MRADLAHSREHITGRVQSHTTDKLEVSTQVGQACGSCKSKCGARRSPQTVFVSARATLSLQRGQAVALDLDSGVLAQISLSLYLLPAMGLLVGAFCSYSMGLGDLPQAVTGLLGLLLGLPLARFVLARRYPAGAPLRAMQITDK